MSGTDDRKIHKKEMQHIRVRELEIRVREL